jgi:hypothetical protein
MQGFFDCDTNPSGTGLVDQIIGPPVIVAGRNVEVTFSAESPPTCGQKQQNMIKLQILDSVTHPHR